MCSVQRPEGTEKGCGGRAGGSHRELSWSPWCGSPWTRGRTGHSHRGNVMEVGGLKQRCGMSDLCGVCVVLCECVRIPFRLKADSCALVWKDHTWFIVHSSVDTGWAASPLGYSPQVCTHLFGALFSSWDAPPQAVRRSSLLPLRSCVPVTACSALCSSVLPRGSLPCRPPGL